LYPELLVSLSTVAQATTTATVAVWVTNPHLRHPLVLASAAASAAESAPGRVQVGIGTGDSALHNAGLAPATLAVTVDFVGAVRDLLRLGSAEWAGHRSQLHTADGPPPRVLVAASGPRGLRLAGMLADGVIIGGPIHDQGIKNALELIGRGAHAVGRDLASLDIWWNIKVAVGPSREEAIHDVAYALASRAHYAFRHSVDDVPRALRSAITDLVAGYQPLHHGALGQATNGKLARDLGLVDFLAERFAVAGTPAECADRLRAAGNLGMVNIFTMLQQRELGSTDPFVTEVMPRLRSSQSSTSLSVHGNL
jgi:5,10-methylenetetrahydromethanopterin reductase